MLTDLTKQMTSTSWPSRPSGEDAFIVKVEEWEYSSIAGTVTKVRKNPWLSSFSLMCLTSITHPLILVFKRKSERTVCVAVIIFSPIVFFPVFCWIYRAMFHVGSLWKNIPARFFYPMRRVH